MKRKLHEPKRKPSRAALRTGPGNPTQRLAQAEPTLRSVEANRLAAIPGPATGRAIPPHEAQEALRASESILRGVFEQSPDPAWIIEGHHFVEANAAALAAVGYGDKTEPLHLHPSKISPELQPDGESSFVKAERHMRTAEEKGVHRFEWVHRRSDGRLVPVEVTLAAIDWHGRKVLYSVWRDITERKRAEQLLRLEHTVSRCLADADNASGGLKAVIRTVCETQNWERGSYWRVDETAGVLRFDAFWNQPGAEFEGYTEGSRDVVFAPGVGLAGRVWQSGEPLWVADPGKDPRVLRKMLARESSIFVFPVFAEGKTIGVLAFFSRESREPDARLLAATRVIGSQVGQFLQRKQTEQALRESEARYRALTELSSDWYWEQDENQRFTRLSGQTVGQEVGANIFVGRTRREAAGIRWDEPELAALEAITEARQPFRDFEIGRTYLDGPKHYVQMSGEPMFDASGRYVGYRGIGKDITERKRRDEDLQRFRAAMDATADQIYLVDRSSMRFIDVNQAACRTQGRSRDELLALGPSGVLSTSGAELERLYDSVIAGGAATEPLELLRRRNDGSEAWVELRRSARRSGEGWMIVTVVRDITSHKRTEAALQQELVRHRETARELLDARIRLAAADRLEAIGRLAAGVAHEVKNPLAIIRLGIDFLSKQFAQESNEAAVLDDVQRATIRADKIITGLLDFSKPKSLVRRPIHINPIIDNAILLVRYEIEPRNIAIVRSYDDSMPSILADPDHLTQVFINLLLNAAQAIGRDGSIEIVARSIRLSERDLERDETGTFRIGERVLAAEIRDNGSGVSPDNQRKLFEPFFTTKPLGEGTGLGLAVSRNIVIMHGGSIDIANRPEGGASVLLMFRVESERSADEAADIGGG